MMEDAQEYTRYSSDKSKIDLYEQLKKKGFFKTVIGKKYRKRGGEKDQKA